MNNRFTRGMEKRSVEFSKRPFARLVRLFAARIFRGSGDADAEGLDLSIGLVLTLLALPGGFVSVLLFPKYGTLLQWMRGVINADPMAASLPDEYFFIVLSMSVTGIVAVWRWGSIFPDRRDYLNLAPLPISTRTILAANFVAIAFLAALIAADVNAASCLLFPLAVGSTQTAFAFFLRFAAVHSLNVLLASLFAFFAVFSLLGFFMAILPQSTFRKFSPYLRTLIILAAVTLLSTSFVVPTMLKESTGSNQWSVGWLPPIWFLGLGMTLLGKAGVGLAAWGRLALPSVCSVIVFSSCVYSFGYGKHFLRISELAGTPVAQSGRKLAWLRALSEIVMKDAPQKACALFVWKTLLRSEPHRLVLAGVGGLGFVLAAQQLAASFTGVPAATGHLSSAALSAPLIVVFFIVAALRMTFEIPVDLRANWIFRLQLDADNHACEAMARKVILIVVLPWTLLVVLPTYCFLGGWVIGFLHTLVVGMWSILLTNAVLIRFRKMPFTCSLPLFQQHSIVTLLLCGLGFFLFAAITPEFESWAMIYPLRMIGLLPFAAVAWYIPYRSRCNSLNVERALIFEEPAPRALELLQIAE